MRTPNDEDGRLLVFGLAGHYIEGVNWTRSGYDRPERIEDELAAGTFNTPLAPSCPVIDKRVVLSRNPSLAFSSPMVDVQLCSGEVDVLNLDAVRRMAPAVSGSFRTIAEFAIRTRATPGPLDRIAVSDYVDLWRGYGARIGRLSPNGKAILWEAPAGH